MRRVREFGAGAFIHKNTGSRPHHKIEDSLKEKIIHLKRSPIYSNANFCHFQELLKEYEHIKISCSAPYVLLRQAGIVSPKKRIRLKVHRRRKRNGQKGLLVQIDASPFNWLGDGDDYNLHAAIDDASGKRVRLYLAKEEC